MILASSACDIHCFRILLSLNSCGGLLLLPSLFLCLALCLCLLSRLLSLTLSLSLGRLLGSCLISLLLFGSRRIDRKPHHNQRLAFAVIFDFSFISLISILVILNAV